MNKKLKEIYLQDQSDRIRASSGTLNWNTVNSNDTKRRNIVMDMYKIDEIKTGLDYYHAAMIFQHGNETKDYEFANELCKIAIKKGNKKALWLYAATFDRILTSKNSKYQKYGTQFRKDSPDSEWYLYPVDPKTTDSERQKYNVPTIQEQKRKVKELNKKS